VLWLPFLKGIELALGFHVAWLPGLVVAGLAVPLLPLALGGARLVTAIATKVALGIGIWLAFTPPYTDDSPGWCNVEHHQDAESARWTVRTFGAEVAFRPVDATEVRPGTWSVDAQRHSEAAAPVVEVLADSSTGSDRRVRIRIASPRGGSAVSLLTLGGEVVIEAVRDREHTLLRPGLGGASHQFVGLSPDGFELDLVLPGGGRRTLVVSDVARIPAGIPGDPRALRPRERVPRSIGDAAYVRTRIEL
jgi:hypothetical protein